MTNLEQAVEEYKSSIEYRILKKHAALIHPYGYTPAQRESCLTRDAVAAYKVIDRLAIKWQVNIKDIVESC